MQEKAPGQGCGGIVLGDKQPSLIDKREGGFERSAAVPASLHFFPRMVLGQHCWVTPHLCPVQTVLSPPSFQLHLFDVKICLLLDLNCNFLPHLHLSSKMVKRLQ